MDKIDLYSQLCKVFVGYNMAYNEFITLNI